MELTPQSGSNNIIKSFLIDGQRPVYLVHGTEIKGFAVRVTPSGAESFSLKKGTDGKVKRLTFGCYPELTIEQARRAIYKLLGHIAVRGQSLCRKEI